MSQLFFPPVPVGKVGNTDQEAFSLEQVERAYTDGRESALEALRALFRETCTQDLRDSLRRGIGTATPKGQAIIQAAYVLGVPL